MTGADMSNDDLVAHWHDLTSGVTRARQRIDQIIDASGVSAQWFAVLHLLLEADEHRLPMNVLAREVSMTSGGFTKLADRMAREGLIDRRGSADDRRVVNATLTSAGETMALETTELYQQTLREALLSVVTAEELAAAAATMHALSAAHADATEAVDDAPVAPVETKRGPDLPDRRGRGRTRE